MILCSFVISSSCLLCVVSINPKFIDKVGAANVKASLLPIWEQFLKSENPGMPEVRLHGELALEILRDEKKKVVNV